MDKQPPYRDRAGTPLQRDLSRDAESRSGRGAASALERMKRLERDQEWMREQDGTREPGGDDGQRGP